MGKQRRKINSTEQQVAVIRDKPAGFPWPAEVYRFPDEPRHERAMAVANRAWRNRVESDWLPADHGALARLAVSQVLHDDAVAELAETGFTTQSEGSRMARPSPLVGVVTGLANVILQISRSLGLTGFRHADKSTVTDHAKQQLSYHPHNSSSGKAASVPLGADGKPDYNSLLMQ